MSVGSWLKVGALAAGIVMGAAAPPVGASVPVGPGSQAHAAVDGDGNVHIVWPGFTSDGQAVVEYCRIAATEDNCGRMHSLRLPVAKTDATGTPRVFVDGSRVLVVVGALTTDVSDGFPGEGRTVLWVSESQGMWFSGGDTVGTTLPLDAVLTRDGTRVITVASAENGDKVQLQSVTTDPYGEPVLAVASLSSGVYLPEHYSIGLSGAAPVAVWDSRFTRHLGGDTNDAASWASPVAHGGPGVQPDLAGGPSGLYMVERAAPGLQLRRFDGAQWGPGQDPTCRDQEHFAGGGLGDAALSQDTAGGLHVAYRGDAPEGTPDPVRYVASADGIAFSDPVTIDAGGQHEGLTVASNGKVGFAVWSRESQGISWVHAQRLPSAPAPGTCDSSGPATGPAPAPSPAPVPAAPPALRPRPPVLRGLTLAPRSFRLRSGKPKLTFSLDRVSRVNVAVHRRLACPADRRKRCRRWAKVRQFALSGRAGANSVALSRAQLRGRPGRYRLTAAPVADGLTGAASTTGYRITKR